MVQTITTQFMNDFGLRVPIAQAPAGSIAGPELAIAVAEAGGMGALALTWTNPEQAAQYVRQARQATNGAFMVNFALAFPPKSLSAVLEAGAKIVSFSWGDPEPYLEQVKQAGAKWGVQVTNVPGAKRALELGADFLVCQGVEAGGHVQSAYPLRELLPRIVEVAGNAGQIPVLAAGGLATGQDIAQVLQMGAAGAVLGTRFVATKESRAHDVYKQRIAQATGDDTALTVCFDGGWPQAMHRVLRNTTLENWEAAGSPPVGKRPGENEIVGATASGEPVFRYEDTAPRQGFTGDIDALCLYAGTGCGRINDIPSARDVVRLLWAECSAYPLDNPLFCL